MSDPNFCENSQKLGSERVGTVMSEPSKLVSTREKLVPTRNSTRISEKSSECRALTGIHFWSNISDNKDGKNFHCSVETFSFPYFFANASLEKEDGRLLSPHPSSIKLTKIINILFMGKYFPCFNTSSRFLNTFKLLRADPIKLFFLHFPIFAV